MVSRVRRISYFFQASRSSSGAHLWVEPAAKNEPIGQTVPTAQNTARRFNLPETGTGRSFDEIPAGRPTSNPRKSKPRHRRQAMPASANTGGTKLGGEPGSPTDRPVHQP